MDKTANANTIGVSYTYDVDDQTVQEQHTDGGASWWVHRHRGRQTDGQAGGSAIEPVLPMVRLVDGQERVSLVEPDGHAMWTVDLGGPDDTFEVLGVYGMPVERFAPPSPWPIDGYHGIERADRYDVAHFGARHMVLRDGLWMQPEPLLYLGLQQVDLTNPAAYGPLYAAGRPTELSDPTGFYVETLIEAGSWLSGVYSFQDNVSQGNYGAATIDAVGVAVDTVGLVAPGGVGAGLWIKGGRQVVDKGSDALRATTRKGSATFHRGVIHDPV